MVATVYLALLLLTSLPAFRSWGAETVSRLLAEKADCKVSIGSLRLNMLGRVVLDNVKLYDQRDTLMLQASRIAAKVDFMPLIEKKIRVSGAQLIGARAIVYKDGDEPFNFQFLVDAFSSKDTTSTPLDLRMGALVVRRGEVRFDRLDKPASPGKLDPNHLHVKDLSLTARLLIQMPDTLALDVRNFSCCEQSGLCLKHLSFEAEAGKSSATIRDLLLRLPESSISVPVLTASHQGFENAFTKEWLTQAVALANITCRVGLHDVPFLPSRQQAFGDALNLTSEVRLDNGTLRLPNLAVRDDADNLSLQCDATISNLFQTPALFADIKELLTGPSLQQFLTQNLQGEAHELSPILTQLGSTKSSGTIAFQNRNLRTNLQAESKQGTVSVDATLNDLREVEANVTLADVKIGHLLDLSADARGTTLSLEANVTGTLPAKDRQAKLSVTGLFNSLIYNGYEHRNVPFSAAIDGKNYEGEVAMDESHGQAHIHLLTAEHQGKRSLQCQAGLKDFAPHGMNLTKQYEGERFSGNLEAEFDDLDLNRLQGELKITGLKIASEDKGTLNLGDVAFNSVTAENGMHMLLESDVLRAKADGNIHPQTLQASFAQPVRRALPSLFTATESHSQPSGNDFRFSVQLQDTLLAERLFGSKLHLPEESILEGSISDAIGQIALQLHIPQLRMGSQQLQNISCRAEAGGATLQASLQCERILKGKPVEINVDAYAKEDKVTSRLRWDNKRSIAHKADISMTGTISRDKAAGLVVDAKINNSHLVIGDTLWQIKPASIQYHDKIVDVHNLSVSQADRYINIEGRISSLASDTLKAELADIDIGYIMDLVNFHKVDFDGRATGSIYGTSLMKKPFADAFLHVKDFLFNETNIGSTDIYANWGKQDRTILLDAEMKGPMPLHHTRLVGTIIPGNGEKDGLDLNIDANHIDIAFLNKFTKKVFSNLQGQASGWTRVFGPFKEVNLEGKMLVNEMKMRLIALGTDYHLAGDSVIMRPDNILIQDARIYDNSGIPGVNEHSAVLNAHLMHDALTDLSFDINVDAHNLHCYNFPQGDGMNFYGTVFADAQVNLHGEPGAVNIDVDVTPTRGTTLIYNVAAPGTVTETEFVTYESLSPTISQGTGEQAGAAEKFTPPIEGKVGDDLKISFNIDANPNAQIRLLMDARTGDNITLEGNGQLKANYYNKGKFELDGTYNVLDGNYRLSVQDLIRKDFTFQPDGTIKFNGDAMQAALNLKAIHTIPNVSLDDLSPSGLGLSNTRVDCIMNIGGTAKEPTISFDFDIPNANEDEKQMVRSMLSSEEERDMQAVYLLGVGRFYTYGTLLDGKQTKSSMAMNSVLSGALSSRFNQIMSQALGGSNWTFGTNLRTGEEGWEHMDVEGMLTGKMLSGRLQFYGNFGYRENKYKMGAGSFIGDFDIQYRLSPRSPFSLKAYNQTNDRYFTQSSLTTQGVGIKFQRDFSRWQELFRRAKKQLNR